MAYSKKRNSIRKGLCMALSVLFILVLTACGKTEETQQSAASKDSINVQGAFILNPADNLDLSADGLDAVQRYLLVVFDVTNNSDVNEDISSRNDSIKLTMNKTNTYEQLSANSGVRLQSFLKNCGYAVSTSYGTLWGGSETVRMCAAFAINGNDIEDSCTAVLDFHLSDHINASVDLTADDIQPISLFDSVFAVEENPDAYQLAHSVKVRAQMCKTALETASQAEHNGNADLRTVQLALCSALFSEETTWGVSCDGLTVSDELPQFSLEAVRLVSPDDADTVEAISSNIAIMIEELDKDAPDYEAVNTAQRTAYNTLTKMTAE